ncbi:hypothetical protein HG531_012371 [Fusarium graminearum]|nr:hypothetical protein HG531_012371 [Fusarium graminearum]
MISFRVDAGLAETFSDHVENVLWKVSLGGKCGLGLQAVGNIAQLRSDEIQRLNTLPGAVDEGLAHDVHLGEDCLGALHGLRGARQKLVGMLDGISNLCDLVGGLDDLDDGGRGGAGAGNLEGS